MVGPIPTTNPTRTLLDVGSVLSPKALEEALDSALRQRLTSLDRLRVGVEKLGGRGSRGPATLGKLLDARGDVIPTDSALETRLSRLLRRHHLPQPQRQVEVRDGQGFVGRVDFAYPELKIAIEVQSYRWHSSRAAWRSDTDRLNRLQALGWIIIQVTYEDLERRPDVVARRIRDAIRPPPGSAGVHLTRRCLAARASSGRRTGVVIGAERRSSGSLSASSAIWFRAAASESSVCFDSVSVGSIMSASSTISGKYDRRRVEALLEQPLGHVDGA